MPGRNWHPFEWANERVRRLPEYDPDSLPIYKLLLSWEGTVLPITVTKPSFIILPSIHLVLALLHEYGGCNEATEGQEQETDLLLDETARRLEEVSWCIDRATMDRYWNPAYPLINVPASMMIFFLVFYSGQCYQRYFQLYDHCVGIAGAFMCWVCLVKTHLKDNRHVQWNCVRYNLAAAHLLYYGMTHGKLEDKEWTAIRQRDLLTEGECEQIRKFDGFKPFLAIFWAMQEVKQQLQIDVGNKSDHNLAAVIEWDEFQRIAFELRAHCSQIANLIKQPVPWAYFHLLNAMVFIVLGLLAFIFVPLAPWPITLFTYIVVCLIFLGLKSLAVSMADPFGDEVTDFRIETYLAGMYNHALAHLSCHFEANGEELPPGINNPLLPDGAGNMLKQMRTCSELVSAKGAARNLRGAAPRAKAPLSANLDTVSLRAETLSAEGASPATAVGSEFDL